MTQTVVANAHGVTTRTIQNWDEQGHPRNTDGSYSLPESIAWYVERQLGDKAQQALTLNAERARLAREQADKTALENAERRGDTARISVMEEELIALYGQFQANVLGLGTKLAPVLEGLDAHGREQAISREVRALLADVADYRPGRRTRQSPDGDHDSDGVGVDTTAGLNGKPVGRRRAKTKSGVIGGTGEVAH